MIRTIIHRLGLNKIVALRKPLDFIKGTMRSTAIPFPFWIQGFWMERISIGDFFHGSYEPETTRLVKKLVKPVFNFVDVGADYGYYSLLVARVSHDQAHIYTFEPSINRFDRYLIPNIRRNNYRNIHTYKLALSDTDKPAPFHLDGGSLYNIKNEKQSQIVECNLLDNIIPGDVKIDLVKIDVEGAEINVLRGMERIIADSHHIKLIIEINPKVLALAGHTAGEITDYLVTRGFGIYCIKRDGSLSKFRDTDDMFAYAYAHKYINVLFQRDNA